MIGILFFGTIAIWAFVALVLGILLSDRLSIQRYRLPWTAVLVVLVFYAPVADEIIAWPQMQALCKQVNGLTLAPGIDAQKASGRTFYYSSNSTSIELWPSSVKVLRNDYAYVDATSKEPILQGVWFEPLRGMLGVPNGSSGGHMTLFLSKCDSIAETYDSQDVPTRFSHLKLTKAPTP